MLRNALLAAAVLLTACPPPPGNGTGGGAAGGEGGGSAVGGGAGGGGGGGGAGGGGGGNAFALSSTAAIRFKRNERMANDFAQALGLTTAQLCNEFGLYSCTGQVHPLALGGVEPYGIGLYEPMPFTGVASPIVVDRVALSACVARMTADTTTPASAVIFKGVTLDATGKLTNVAGPEVSTALDLLYKKVVQRPATPEELAHHRQLYADIVASGKPDPGKSWMTLSCFAVLSSVESVFY